MGKASDGAPAETPAPPGQAPGAAEAGARAKTEGAPADFTADALAVARSGFPSEHPLRYALTNELHARPFEVLTPPVRISLYASVTGEAAAAEVQEHLKSLCDRYGLTPPPEGRNHFTADFGPFRLRFERHTEFVTYTVIRHGRFGKPFEEPAASFLPADWRASIPGEVLAATHLAILPVEGDPPTTEELEELFVPQSLVTSIVAGQAAQVWTDLRIHADGHNRLLLKPRDLPPPKAGRVAQRLLEIATYRNLALLGLPVAREVGPELTRIDAGLAELTGEMASLAEHGAETPQRESELLIRLMQLSAQIEKLSSRHSYRFSAARAYYALVQSRLTELREERLDGYQTVREFLDRRLGPAMRTIESVEDRLANMSRRATRAANLLRTRVDFMLERQNQNLLGSMDRRAKLQLRLQQTVEGLSVAAITYYTVGLAGYAATGLADAGVPVNPDYIQGAAVPLIGITVWIAMRRVRKAMERED
jgi:uncharacterized membrane-anchored protein